MNLPSIEKMTEAYKQEKHLMRAADILNMKWQTLYWHLKKANVDITGDKAKYGSHSDKLAIKGERLFQEIIPYALDQNAKQFQSKIDFLIGNIKIDVKTSKAKHQSQNCKTKRYAFSLKKQIHLADFFVLFCLDDREDAAHILLIPRDLIIDLQTISVAVSGCSKWMDFKVSKNELRVFFDEYRKIESVG